MKRQTFTGVLLAICVCLLIGLLPSLAPTSAADDDPPPPWPLTWVEMAPMPTPRYSAGIAVSKQQTIYVMGGDNYSCVTLTTVEEYDPETNSWHVRADLPTGRWGLGAALGADRRIYAIGGQGGDCWSGLSTLDTVEAYDPRSDTWTTRASMPTPRFLLGVVAGANGKIYALGGEDGTGVLATVEEYDPISDTWTAKADMPMPNRNFASVSASNGKIYIIGGYWLTNVVWEFDPVADTWVQKASMPTGRDTLGAAQVKNGLIYAVAGECWGPLNTVEAYDLRTDTWIPAISLAGARRFLAVAALHKSVYAIGGWGILADGTEGPVGLVEAAITPNVNALNP